MKIYKSVIYRPGKLVRSYREMKRTIVVSPFLRVMDRPRCTPETIRDSRSCCSCNVYYHCIHIVDLVCTYHCTLGRNLRSYSFCILYIEATWSQPVLLRICFNRIAYIRFAILSSRNEQGGWWAAENRHSMESARERERERESSNTIRRVERVL